MMKITSVDDTQELLEVADAILVVERYRKKLNIPSSTLDHITILVERLSETVKRKHVCENCGKYTKIYVFSE